MIIFFLIFIICIALPSFNREISPISVLRIATLILIYFGALVFNVFYIQSIGSGIGIYGGLFQFSSVSQLLDTYLLLIGALILIPRPGIINKATPTTINNLKGDVRNVNLTTNQTSPKNSLLARYRKVILIILFSTLGLVFITNIYDLLQMNLHITDLRCKFGPDSPINKDYTLRGFNEQGLSLFKCIIAYKAVKTLAFRNYEEIISDFDIQKQRAIGLLTNDNINWDNTAVKSLEDNIIHGSAHSNQIRVYESLASNKIDIVLPKAELLNPGSYLSPDQRSVIYLDVMQSLKKIVKIYNRINPLAEKVDTARENIVTEIANLGFLPIINPQLNLNLVELNLHELSVLIYGVLFSIIISCALKIAYTKLIMILLKFLSLNLIENYPNFAKVIQIKLLFHHYFLIISIIVLIISLVLLLLFICPDFIFILSHFFIFIF